jgi:predicted HicB family RNase H-like nuclease
MITWRSAPGGGNRRRNPYSGKLILRIPPDLHRKVSAKAMMEKVSINHLIAEALKAYTTKNLGCIISTFQ